MHISTIEPGRLPTVTPSVARANAFFDLVARRGSIRAYSSRPVEELKLEGILGALRRAPSAGNLQAYEVVVVRDEARRKKLAQAAYGQSFVAEAPLVLAFFANPERSRRRYGDRGSRLFACQDATIAAAYAQLAAQALGLGSVWVGAFDDTKMAAAVGASRWLRPQSLLVIGYPAEHPEATSRRQLSEHVHYEELPASESEAGVPSNGGANHEHWLHW